MVFRRKNNKEISKNLQEVFLGELAAFIAKYQD
jgi:hypothetical protein